MIPNELIRDALEAALVVAIKDPVGAPKPLQPFLKFQKMPARAMPAVRKVLDTDDAFRERVASLVALGVLDQAGVLFLTRPEGWEADLERLASEGAQAEADAEAEKAEKSAQRKLKAAEAARTRAEERVNDLTGELERTRAVLEQERVAKRQAETTAHNVTWDVDNLRKRVRELESSAEAWAQERDELKRQVASAAPAATPVASTAAVEALDLSDVTDALREARLALAAAARSLDDAVRAVPDEQPSTALEAAAAQERRIRPPKHARRPEALPGGVRDDSVEAARHLLRVRHVVVVVDGYNVAKRGWPDLTSLADQRDRLLDRLVGLHASTRAEFQIVFDGTQAGSIAATKGQPVTVVFTESGTTADDEILRLLPSMPRERAVVVASSDREVADGARRLGANVISAEQLLAAG